MARKLCPDEMKIGLEGAFYKLILGHVCRPSGDWTMTARRYLLYDVFTQKALSGNQLAIVIDCDGLDTRAMQAIAREFNLSETVFVLAPAGSARTPIRIFTPVHEMRFAGHPTVGTAIALVEATKLADNDNHDSDAVMVVLDEPIGKVSCVVTRKEAGTLAEFALPKLPVRAAFDISREGAAAALGLDPDDIGFESHVVTAWDAGAPYVCVPVRDLNAAGRASLNPAVWREMIGDIPDEDSPAPYVYCRDTVHRQNSFHARMFAGHIGIPEDPATGSAAATLAAAIMQFDRPVDGTAEYWIEQGLEMGRPSSILLQLDVQGGRLEAARLGGYAVKVGEGTLYI
jgi:trans-2,3-dihydro-3-hydroxyanthranilate isomerase